MLDSSEGSKKLYFDIFVLKGRINRSRYLGLFSFWIFLMTFIFILHDFYPTDLAKSIYIAMLIIIVINVIFLDIRRLRDMGRSGYYALFRLIPFVNIIFQLALICSKGIENKEETLRTSSSNLHLFLCGLLPILFIIQGVYLFTDISAKIFHSWKVINNPRYSISFPDDYLSKNLGSMTSNISHTKNTVLVLNTVTYKDLANTSNSKTASVGEKAFDMPTQELFNFLKENQLNVKYITNDKLINQNGLKGRLIEGTFTQTDNSLAEDLFKLEFFNDPKNQEFYMLIGFYDKYYHADKSSAIVNNFLQSFKIYS